MPTSNISNFFSKIVNEEAKKSPSSRKSSREVGGKGERREASDHPQSVLPPNWGEIEPNHTVTCIVLKATTNDRRHLAICHDELHGPRFGICRSGGIGINNRFIKTKASKLL
ncbi:uncharacterized protein TNCV_4853111 [Trichonephila clavipes]|nr:uncharacterized protein TNCV_4853111 [Trichonephila clavipes]